MFVNDFKIPYRRNMTLTEIQAALSRLETRPRQSLGQNFLHDQNLCRWIVAQLDLQPGEHVVEVGPGLGALTEYLVESGCRVTCIEKDGNMVRWLEEKFQGAGVELFHMDALKFDLRKLYGNGPVKFVGNLPYYVSTPLIAKYASALSPASILVLTLQHEVAARLNATPGTKDFGAMSVCSSRRWDIKYARKLPASVFYPQPKVSSAVLTMRRKPASDVPVCDEELFESLVRRGFGERRKQLRKLLPEYRANWAELCVALRVPETVRAEELTLAQWEEFARLVQPALPQHGGEMFDVVDAEDRVIEPCTCFSSMRRERSFCKNDRSGRIATRACGTLPQRAMSIRERPTNRQQRGNCSRRSECRVRWSALEEFRVRKRLAGNSSRCIVDCTKGLSVSHRSRSRRRPFFRSIR
jgi:16S rRNA (adenine1518-N6/adenine1519-N6)-dimethyltransferase